jgi:restriction endonuclease S subunit
MLRHKNEIKCLANGTAQQYIALGDIRKFSILLPDFDAMTKFTKLVEQLLSRISIIHIDNKALAAICDTLSPQLLAGEVSLDNFSCD